ncbi:UDP-glucose 4-epimerase GalE [Paenibacillus lautus]|uniref:UDP-glucose 4-epimerase GalE n=1 Tax=Paenibacillus lautus TaxID=1401 RepID=UPI003D2A62B5
MNILVTGGLGFIGSHVCVELIKFHDVIIADNLTNSKLETLYRIEELSGRKIKYYNVNLLDNDHLNMVFARNKIEVVIHLAGLKSISESIAAPLLYYENNVIGTINLCNTMNNYNVKKLVFSSSATVYGNNNKNPLKEHMSLTAITPYGYSKLIVENLLNDLYKSDKSWKITILRYFNPVGAHESGLIGENSKIPSSNLFPIISNASLGNYTKLFIFGNDYPTHDGTAIRDYIHVVDLARAHVRAIEKIGYADGVRIYNIGVGIGHSVLEVIKHFEEVSGHKIKYEFTSRREGDVAISYADPNKAKKELNWEASRDLHQMCYDTWKWSCRGLEK